MTRKEFKRWLQKQGCVFNTKRGKGSHELVRLGNRKATFPNGGSKEIPIGTRKSILKELGLKE